MKKNVIVMLCILLVLVGAACAYASLHDEANTDEQRTARRIYHSQLQEKYPQFYNVSTDGGLTVYIWQMAENNYKFYLVNSVIDAFSDRTFAFEVGTTITEMRAILSTYDVDKDDIVIRPTVNPISSYAYKIDDAYTEQLIALFWSDEEGIVP